MDSVKAAADGSWVRGDLYLGAHGMGYDKVLERVQHLLPPPPINHYYAFIPFQWTVQVTLNAVLNTGKWESSGFAVNSFEINRAASDPKLFIGIKADVAVRDKDGAAQLHRVSYDVDMYGYFILIETSGGED